MKIIHCADLHLDSKLNANLDNIRARERRSELLNTFARMVRYAADNGVEAILIAGDMFDTRNVTRTTCNTVLHLITENPYIRFYYLKGNHDEDSFLSGLDEIPDNLKLFGETWKTYDEDGGRIHITGLELSADNSGLAYVTLVTDTSGFNIVMLHGQESETASKDRAEVINLRALRNRGIDYLALGHVHAYKKEKLDARGTYCYSGCLEGRGFDECGEHGFVLLDIDTVNHSYTHTFVPFAARKLLCIEVFVTGLETTAEMIKRTDEAIAAIDCGEMDMVKVVLKGNLDVECEKDISFIETHVKDKFFFAKVYDETGLKIEAEDYLHDESLKGEFVRLVLADGSLNENEKMNIIRYGLHAISGEEI